MKENMEFKIGDKVTWESQAQGVYKVKTGTVVMVLNRKECGYFIHKTAYRIAQDNFPNHKIMFDGSDTPGKNDPGYLIEVISGKKAKPKLYMPYPSKLRKVEE